MARHVVHQHVLLAVLSPTQRWDNTTESKKQYSEGAPRNQQSSETTSHLEGPARSQSVGTISPKMIDHPGPTEKGESHHKSVASQLLD
ncbi:hypothetical protein JTB14_021068 [Gonioctena quinquepunctata]|nr:hypothetical protein JTB14_021068 [Gonioctena quinquepunctata]